jgi:hypothetical protein
LAFDQQRILNYIQTSIGGDQYIELAQYEGVDESGRIFAEVIPIETKVTSYFKGDYSLVNIANRVEKVVAPIFENISIGLGRKIKLSTSVLLSVNPYVATTFDEDKPASIYAMRIIRTHTEDMVS